MSFSYDLSNATDVTRVRFHVGDTIESAAIFSDEEIQFAIDEAGTYQEAVIWCIQSIIAKISAEPDMQADWLRVDMGRSVEGYKTLLQQKRGLFGISGSYTVTATTVHTYRADSFQTEEPDWASLAEEDEDD